MIDRINAANGVAVDAITANANYLSALDGLSAQAEKVGTSLDESTVSGSANAAAMGELAEKARAAAEAQFQQDVTTMGADESAKKYAETLAAQKQAFIDSAVSAGYNADQVKALADRIFQMPTEKEFQALVQTAQAQSQIDNFINLNNGRRVKVHVDVEGNESFRVGSKTVSAFSRGGPVRGPGTSTSDSIEARLSDGEYVLTADDVNRAGGHSKIDEWRAMMSGSGASTNPTPFASLGGLSYPSGEGKWVSGAQIANFYGQPANQAAPVISLDGLSITGRLDIGGDGLASIVDGRIWKYDESRSQITRGGARGV
ncbi:hypothetical protein [Microbacterium sp. MYb66]|uniref:hypothetical protein n=1 Tax=Microbacterium sp. MYb66 TaxID=1848692 RepID=UPI000D41C169|nr:hypothetical protein [Microbacterium sp. MYb66]PRA79192.1 hypothetical protein CQ045_15560 [Microbacterium sp. MYb66]